MRPCILVAACLLVATLGCKKTSPPDVDGGGAAAKSDLPGLSPLSFLGTFEGEIDLYAKDDKPGTTPTPVSLFVKTGKIRFDVPEKLTAGRGAMLGPKAYVIFDSAAKRLSIVSDAQMQAIVIDLNKSGEQFKGFGGGGPPARHGGSGLPDKAPTKVTKTGKFDKVAGYECENWEIASDHRQGSVCVAQEGASWFHVPITGIPTEHLWMTELLDGKHFPLRFIGFQKDGATEESRIEVTKIDKKTLAASEFEYPPTYRVVDLAQVLAGVGASLGSMPTLPHPLPHPTH